MAALERSFAISDSAVGARSILQGKLAKHDAENQHRQVTGEPSPTGICAVAFGEETWSDLLKNAAPIRNDAYVNFGLGQREQEVFQRCPVIALTRSTFD